MKPSAVLCIALCSAGLYAAEIEVKLPAPYATPSARNFSKVVPRPAGAELQLPAGFVVEEYLSGFERPRFMLLGPSKELLIADSAPGTDGVVYGLRPRQDVVHFGPGKSGVRRPTRHDPRRDYAHL